MRKFRYIEPGYGCDSLSQHEKDELLFDFDIETAGYYAIVPVSRAEFDILALTGLKIHTDIQEFIRQEVKDELDRRGCND